MEQTEQFLQAVVDKLNKFLSLTPGSQKCWIMSDYFDVAIHFSDEMPPGSVVAMSSLSPNELTRGIKIFSYSIPMTLTANLIYFQLRSLPSKNVDSTVNLIISNVLKQKESGNSQLQVKNLQ